MKTEHEPITPKNLNINLSQFEQKKQEVLQKPEGKENTEFFYEKSESPENIKIITKINEMICKWVEKYKFHTKSIVPKCNDDYNHFMSEFSNPSSQKPIPEATAIVILLTKDPVTQRSTSNSLKGRNV
jgi:hypothetical protein